MFRVFVITAILTLAGVQTAVADQIKLHVPLQLSEVDQQFPRIRVACWVSPQPYTSLDQARAAAGNQNGYADLTLTNGAYTGAIDVPVTAFPPLGSYYCRLGLVDAKNSEWDPTATPHKMPFVREVAGGFFSPKLVMPH
jgi:hypothetical protein